MNYEAVKAALDQGFILISAMAYLVGAFIVAGALSRIVRMGRREFMMNANWQERPMGIAADLASGAMLVYLASSVDMLTGTLFSSGPSPLSVDAVDNHFGQLVIGKILTGYVRLVGLIAIFRGLLLVGKIGENSHNGSPVGRIISFLIAGTLAFNIDKSANMIADLSGVDILAFMK